MVLIPFQFLNILSQLWTDVKKASGGLFLLLYEQSAMISFFFTKSYPQGLSTPCGNFLGTT